jgi:hypothetical protein
MWMVTRSRYRHFDDLWREFRQAMPPRCGQATGGSFGPVSPNRDPYACRIGEWAVVDEEDARRTTPPASRADTTVDRVSAQSRLLGLRECDHAVLLTKIIVDHELSRRRDACDGSTNSDLCAKRSGERS